MGTRRPLTPHAEAHLVGVIRAFPRARITSTWRTKAENAAVGGVPGSFHTVGRAADIVVPAGQKRALIGFLWRQRVTRFCTGPEEVLDEGDHVHVAW